MIALARRASQRSHFPVGIRLQWLLSLVNRKSSPQAKRQWVFTDIKSPAYL
jgi:hypothetical protein